MYTKLQMGDSPQGWEESRMEQKTTDYADHTGHADHTDHADQGGYADRADRADHLEPVLRKHTAVSERPGTAASGSNPGGRKRNGGKRLGWRIFSGVLTVVLTVVLMAFVGFTVFDFIKGKFFDEAADRYINEERTVDVVRSARVDQTEFEYLISLDQKTDGIARVWLSVFDTQTGNLTYLILPADFTGTVSDTVKDQLHLVTKPLPSSVRLSEFPTYFAAAELGDYTSLILDEWLGISSSCWSYMDASYFDKLFGDAKITDFYTNRMNDFSSKEDVTAFLEQYYANVTTNLSYARRLSYAAAMANLRPEYIYYYNLPGSAGASGFVMDSAETADILGRIRTAGTYSMTQSSYYEKLNAVSTDASILVLNGTNVKGLASRTKERLTAAGYKVTGIGNYKETDIEKTIIQVTEDGLGVDLLKLFTGSVYEVVPELPDGVDIRIIIGSADSDRT